MEYDKLRFIDNVYALAPKKGLKIKEIEAACGVSIGYFARLRLGKKGTAPGADFLLKVADQLSVSVDSLLCYDFSSGSDSEQLLLIYLEKLIDKTQNGSMFWQEDPVVEPDSILNNLGGIPTHPLYNTVQLESGKVAAFYDSPFHPFSTDLVPLIAYGCPFPDDRTLYLVQVTKRADNSPDNLCDWTELELVMAGDDLASPIPLCHTDHNKPAYLDNLMYQLLSIIEDKINTPLLTPEALDVINDFLK